MLPSVLRSTFRLRTFDDPASARWRHHLSQSDKGNWDPSFGTCCYVKIGPQHNQSGGGGGGGGGGKFCVSCFVVKVLGRASCLVQTVDRCLFSFTMTPFFHASSNLSSSKTLLTNSTSASALSMSAVIVSSPDALIP